MARSARGTSNDDSKDDEDDAKDAELEHDEKFTQYVKEEIVLLRDSDYTSQDAHRALKEDFCDWNDRDFRRVKKAIMREFRDLLWNLGVYTPRDNTTVVEHVIRLFHGEFPEWPSDQTIPALKVRKDLERDTNLASGGNRKPAKVKEEDVDWNAFTTSSNRGDSNIMSLSKFSRELGNLEKFYKDDALKYSGVDDSIDHKMGIFIGHARRAGIPEEGLVSAFTLMLTGEAQDFYYASEALFTGSTLDELRQTLRERFEPEEYFISRYTEWNNITLQGVIDRNPGKSVSECLELMLSRLHHLHLSFPAKLQEPALVHARLVSAVQSREECHTAIQRSSTNPHSLRVALKTATNLYDAAHPVKALAGVNYTDRRYHQDQPRGSSSMPKRSKSSAPQSPGQEKTVKKCIVCRKPWPECWSSKHPKREVEKAWEKARDEKRRMEREQRSITQYLTQFHIDEKDDEIDESGSVNSSPSGGEITTATDSDQYVTDFGMIVDGPLLQTHLTDLIVYHQILPQDPAPCELHNYSVKWSEERFNGIMIDTGAAHASSVGWNQYQAFQHWMKQFPSHKQQKLILDKTTEGAYRFKYGMGTTLSKGIIRVNLPIGCVDFHLVDPDTPFLLSLHDLDRLGYYFNNCTNMLVNHVTNDAVPVSRMYGHGFLTWDSPVSHFCVDQLPITHLSAFPTSRRENDEFEAVQLSEQDLRRLHRRFGHPSVDRMARVLDASNHEFDREMLKAISKMCESCQKHQRGPGRFKFTLKDEALFNHSVIADIFHLDGGPVLHVIDEATRFQSARFLDDVSAKHVWDVFRACWIDTYLGPPDILTTDSGTQLMSAEFTAKAKGMSIKMVRVPVEAHHSIGMVERYHKPLRRAYTVIRSDLPDIKPTQALQMAVKAVNDTAGPDALTPTLLVFGAYPRMADSDPPHPSIIERARAIERAMKEVQDEYAKRHVTEALRMRNGPIVDEELNAPLGSDVLVFREKTRTWDGPYTLIAVDGHTCWVSINHRVTPFRITSVKVVHKEPESGDHDTSIEELSEDDLENDIAPDNDGDNDEAPEESTPEPRPRRERRLPERYTLITTKERANLDLASKLREEKVITGPNGPFVDSRKQEVNGLLEQGVFVIVQPHDVPQGSRFFSCRFVDEVKYKAGAPYEKSRLVVQGHNDKDKEFVLTQAPTIQRCSQRMIFLLAVILKRSLYLRDISQAYINSKTKLNRPIYVRAPPGIDLGGGFLKVVRPLYGIAEAGTHWFKTYHEHHLAELNLKLSTIDPCLMYSDEAVVGLQTDDTLFCATESYVELEEQARAKKGFPAKPIDKLTKDHQLQFNGAVIAVTKNGIHVSQRRQCEKIKLVDVTGPNYLADSVKQRASGLTLLQCVNRKPLSRFPMQLRSRDQVLTT